MQGKGGSEDVKSGSGVYEVLGGQVRKEAFPGVGRVEGAGLPGIVGGKKVGVVTGGGSQGQNSAGFGIQHYNGSRFSFKKGIGILLEGGPDIGFHIHSPLFLAFKDGFEFLLPYAPVSIGQHFVVTHLHSLAGRGGYGEKAGHRRKSCPLGVGTLIVKRITALLAQSQNLPSRRQDLPPRHSYLMVKGRRIFRVRIQRGSVNDGPKEGRAGNDEKQH